MQSIFNSRPFWAAIEQRKKNFFWSNTKNTITILNTTMALSFIVARPFNENFNYLQKMILGTVLTFPVLKFANNTLLNHDYKKKTDIKVAVHEIKETEENLENLRKEYFLQSEEEIKKIEKITKETTKKKVQNRLSMQTLNESQLSTEITSLVEKNNSFRNTVRTFQETHLIKPKKYIFGNKVIRFINKTSFLLSQAISINGLCSENYFLTKLFFATMIYLNSSTTAKSIPQLCVTFGMMLFLHPEGFSIKNNILCSSIYSTLSVAYSRLFESNSSLQTFNASNENSTFTSPVQNPIEQLNHSDNLPSPQIAPNVSQKTVEAFTIQNMQDSSPAQNSVFLPVIFDQKKNPVIFSTSSFNQNNQCSIEPFSNIMINQSSISQNETNTLANIPVVSQTMSATIPSYYTLSLLAGIATGVIFGYFAFTWYRKWKEQTKLRNTEQDPNNNLLIEKKSEIITTNALQIRLEKAKNELQEFTTRYCLTEIHDASTTISSTKRYFITKYALSTIQFCKGFVLHVSRSIVYVALSTLCIFAIITRKGREYLKSNITHLFTNFTGAAVSLTGIISPHFGRSAHSVQLSLLRPLLK